MQSIPEINRVEIEINQKCNLSCSYCPNSSFGGRGNAEMEPAVFKKILTELKTIDFKGAFAYHFYGEPLLANKLEEYLDLTNIVFKDNLKVIYTNGIFLSIERLTRLLSIDNLLLRITKHESTKRLPIDDFFANLSNEFKKRVLYENEKDLVKSNRGGLLKHIPGSAKNYPCAIPRGLVVFTVNGDVLPCFEDYLESFKLGNIMSSSLASILNSKARKELIDKLAKGKREEVPLCAHCNNRSLL